MRSKRGFWLSALLLPLAAALYFAQPVPMRADTPTGACPIFPSSSIFYANVASRPTTTDSATMIAFLSTTNGTPGVIDKQFSAGDEGQSVGKHKGFEFTYLQTTTPVPSVTVIPSNTRESDFGPAPIPTYAKIQGGVTNTPTNVPGTPTVTPTRTPGPNTPTATRLPDSVDPSCDRRGSTHL